MKKAILFLMFSALPFQAFPKSDAMISNLFTASLFGLSALSACQYIKHNSHYHHLTKACLAVQCSDEDRAQHEKLLKRLSFRCSSWGWATYLCVAMWIGKVLIEVPIWRARAHIAEQGRKEDGRKYRALLADATQDYDRIIAGWRDVVNERDQLISRLAGVVDDHFVWRQGADAETGRQLRELEARARRLEQQIA